ncbi:MAG: ribulose-phosphate 3-epimerase, partial [Candidatus Omnitrophica bacterium]|nr:ribulose-phosphate 3-epimerase [Candidatus Omnitrophota bacterium]
MDGHFVPNLSLGPVIVEAIHRVSRLPLDVHLMIEHPEQYIRSFLEAGGSRITVHIEATGLRNESILRRTLEQIRQGNAAAGLSLRPRTMAESVLPFLAEVDQLLVMTVEPGFGGQSFLSEVVPKITQLRHSFKGNIIVDGGINAETGRVCRQAGADVFVAGTYIFKSSSYEQAILSLRG